MTTTDTPGLFDMIEREVRPVLADAPRPRRARAPKERKPTPGQRALLEQIAALGGVRVHRHKVQGGHSGQWDAIVHAGWTSMIAGDDPDWNAYTLTLPGWVHAGADEFRTRRDRMTVSCVQGNHAPACEGLCGPRVYGNTRPCVCPCHHRTH
jgi:hypothetical protein